MITIRKRCGSSCRPEASGRTAHFPGKNTWKLRSFVTGKAVRPERIGRFAIGLREGWEGQQIEIRRFALSWEQPDCPFSGKPLVDLLGQKKEGNWPGKRSSVEDLKKGLQEERQALLEEEGWKERSSYGGYTGLRLSATGYFRLEKTESHWWLVDPEGCAFLTAGMDCVRTDECTPIDGLESCYDWLPEKGGEYDQALRPDPWMRKEAEEYMNFPVANLIRCFGADWRQEWERLTVSRLRSWGFNTIGAFSDEDFIRRSNMPYTRTLMGYPSTRCKIYRDFPDVFSQEYLESAKAYAAQLNEGRNDANMIGYYMKKTNRSGLFLMMYVWRKNCLGWKKRRKRGRRFCIFWKKNTGERRRYTRPGNWKIWKGISESGLQAGPQKAG